MSGPKESTVQINGYPCRVWAKGEGEPLGFLAGLGGLQKWPPLLEALSRYRRVIAPSIPGFPGSEGHETLDTHLDWVIAVQELLEAAGLAGADLMGVSLGGSLAAEVAAVWPGFVRRLVLVAPLGMYDDAAPVADVFAQAPGALPGLLCENAEAYQALTDAPEEADPMDWRIMQMWAGEAAARMLWPLGNTRIARRLHRISQPTLLIWGEADRVLAPSYARRFADAMGAVPKITTLPGAGHLADVDQPGEVSRAVLEFLAE